MEEFIFKDQSWECTVCRKKFLGDEMPNHIQTTMWLDSERRVQTRTIRTCKICWLGYGC